MSRPEIGLREVAEEMLRAIFDPSVSDEDVRAAAITLVEVVAPDILADSVREAELEWAHELPVFTAFRALRFGPTIYGPDGIMSRPTSPPPQNPQPGAGW